MDDYYPDITIQEITNALTNLKNGKSTSADWISIEMLKNGGNMLLKPLQKTVQHYFKLGTLSCYMEWK